MSRELRWLRFEITYLPRDVSRIRGRYLPRWNAPSIEVDMQLELFDEQATGATQPVTELVELLPDSLGNGTAYRIEDAVPERWTKHALGWTVSSTDHSPGVCPNGEWSLAPRCVAVLDGGEWVTDVDSRAVQVLSARLVCEVQRAA